MRLELSGHPIERFKQRGIDPAIGLDNGIPRIGNVIINGTMIGVYDDLYSVTNVVEAFLIRLGIRVPIRIGIGVLDPIYLPCSDDNIGILVQPKKGGQGLDPLDDVAPEENTAASVSLGCEKDIALFEIERKHKLSKKIRDRYTPPTFIIG